MAYVPKSKRRKCRECGKNNAIIPAFICPSCKITKKKASKQKSHDKHVVETYGLNPGEYKAILESQGGVCYICGGKGGGKALAVDHDHNLNGRDSVRAILCQQCNYTLLGRILKDDPERAKTIFERVIQVLTEYPAQTVLKKE